MDISIIFKIAAIGILTAVSSIILKQTGKDEIGLLVTLSGLIICLVMVISMVSELFTTLKNLFMLY